MSTSFMVPPVWGPASARSAGSAIPTATAIPVAAASRAQLVEMRIVLLLLPGGRLVPPGGTPLERLSLVVRRHERKQDPSASRYGRSVACRAQPPCRSQARVETASIRHPASPPPARTRYAARSDVRFRTSS